MTQITIEPERADRFADAEHALTGGGDGADCWCQWWMHAPKDFTAMSVDQRRARLREDLTAAVPSALIAHVDGEAAGWVKVAPRPAQPRLAGYPLDTEIKRFSSNELFHGTLSAFLGAGFTETARPGAARPIVAKALS